MPAAIAAVRRVTRRWSLLVWLSFLPTAALAQSPPRGADPAPAAEQPAAAAEHATDGPSKPASPGPSTSVMAGGPGGVVFSDACPPGAIAVGLHGRAGALIDALGVECQSLTYGAAEGAAGPAVALGAMEKRPPLGGPGGQPFEQGCVQGDALIGVTGRAARCLNTVEAICAPLAFDAQGQLVVVLEDALPTGEVGGAGGEAYTARCPDGSVVVGLAGRGGKLVDAVAIRCAPLPTAPSPPAAGTPAAERTSAP